mgnify:CR=1 FL=1
MEQNAIKSISQNIGWKNYKTTTSDESRKFTKENFPEFYNPGDIYSDDCKYCRRKKRVCVNCLLLREKCLKEKNDIIIVHEKDDKELEHIKNSDTYKSYKNQYGHILILFWRVKYIKGNPRTENKNYIKYFTTRGSYLGSSCEKTIIWDNK